MKSNSMTTRLLRAIGGLRAALVLASVALLAACGGGGEVVIPAPSTAVSTTNLRALPQEYLARKAVAYSPWRTANRETERAGLVDPVKSAAFNANIKQDLELLVAGNFRLIRIFDSYDGPVDPGTGLAVEGMARRILRIIDDNNLDIKVQLGGYINSVKYVLNPVVAASIRAENQRELDRVVALATDPKFEDIVLAVSVGNETMVVWSPVPVVPDEMALHIKYVRDRVRQPVTTDDDFQFWREAPKVITDQIDFVAAHLYPEVFTKFPASLFYYDWRQEGAAEGPARTAAMMAVAMAKTREVYQMVRDRMDRNGLTALPVAITEVGWNAVDLGQLRFRAHPANQKMYFDQLAAFRAEGRVGVGPANIFYFQAFDEPWKLGDDGWGLFNVNRQARYVVQNLYPPAIWETPIVTDADALFFKQPVPTVAFAATRYTLYSDAPGAVVATGLRVDAFDGNSVSAPEVVLAAPLQSGDGSRVIELTPVPKDYGWGLLYSSTTPYGSENLSAFEATGAITFLVKTTYPGKIEVGISTDTATGDVQETYLQFGSGEFGYQNDGNWHLVSIPLQRFKAVNPKLDLSMVLTRFAIADRYSFTGKSLNSNITDKISIDAIQWSR